MVPRRAGRPESAVVQWRARSFELAHELLVEGHLKGEAHAERDGQVMKAKLDLTRKSD